jgi:hypothetical protein
VYPGNRRRRWLRWGLLYCAGVLAVFVIGLVIEAAVSPGPKQPQALNPAVPSPPWMRSAALSPAQRAASPGQELTGPVAVVPGRQLINGVELGFPHSAVGAVSAPADVMSEAGSTLDPDRAAAVMRMTADPSVATAPQEAAHGAVSDRRYLGIPASGPVPPGASVQILPAEYQVPSGSADQVLVLLLCDFITTQPEGGTQTRIAVFPLRMHWAQADWKAAAVGGGNYLNLAAGPGSPQSADLGWQQLQMSGG